MDVGKDSFYRNGSLYLLVTFKWLVDQRKKIINCAVELLYSDGTYLNHKYRFKHIQLSVNQKNIRGMCETKH